MYVVMGLYVVKSIHADSENTAEKEESLVLQFWAQVGSFKYGEKVGGNK